MSDNQVATAAEYSDQDTVIHMETIYHHKSSGATQTQEQTDSVATQPTDSGGAQAYAANAQANSEGAQANAAGAQAK
ncbi:hypothetical protein DIS24_g9967 [Lasiodiplodia hormozganensis]|uniref:Uncharacterized protein n=1 Tax=Lasiodiplodia hormozganensis TaxID=869390 RepID=A0AA40CI13_9PEZI|nr:hypothetical protein DIS24_g9967 [Lasiodiplodia hormozganensis]